MPGSRRVVLIHTAIVAGVLLLAGSAGAPPARDSVPARIDDSTFWRMVTTFSEPSGTFPSENFVSNETEWQYVIPAALNRVKPGGAYIGVGPEQNFTYIAALHPRIAFICDIRRQNLIEHLMYKALIESSSNRVEFLSKLWSRLRPDGVDTMTDPAAVAAAFAKAPKDSVFYKFNVNAIFARLVNQHKFALNSEDSATLRAVYGVFFSEGPAISYSSSSRRGGGYPFASGGLTSVMPGRMALPAGGTGLIMLSSGNTTTVYHVTTDSTGQTVFTRDSAGIAVRDTTMRFPAAFGTLPVIQPGFGGGIYATFGSLMSLDDGAGVNRGWLGSEAAFQWLKDFESRNLLVPVVGDFGGPKALRSVAGYLKDNDLRVGAFYTSNVEQYLFQHGIDAEFYENVGAMPADSNSIFIRSFPTNIRSAPPPRNPGSRLSQTTSSIIGILRSYRNGLINDYTDLGALQDR